MISKVIIKRAKKKRYNSWSVKSIEEHLTYLDKVDTTRPEILEKVVYYWEEQLEIVKTRNKKSH